MSKHNFLVTGHTLGKNLVRNIDFDAICDTIRAQNPELVYENSWRTYVGGSIIRRGCTFLTWFKFWCCALWNDGITIADAKEIVGDDVDDLSLESMERHNIIKLSSGEYVALPPTGWNQND